jgi:hypothetical protein
LAAGGTFQIRFASVENQSFMIVGVDNVALQQIVPEPASLALSGLGLLGSALAGIVGRRRRSRARA